MYKKKTDSFSSGLKKLFLYYMWQVRGGIVYKLLIRKNAGNWFISDISVIFVA